MKRVIAINLLALSTLLGCASKPPQSEVVKKDNKLYLVQHVTEINEDMLRMCPNGFKKFAEQARKIDGEWYLVIQFECLE